MDSGETEHADTVASPAAERHRGRVDEADFAELVAPHLEAMLHLADRLAGPAGCYAVIERALGRAWRQRRTLASGPGGTRARLLAIVAGRAWRKGTRRRPAKRTLEEAVSGYEPDTEVADALERLPRQQRIAAELRYYLQENASQAAGSRGRDQTADQEVLADATAAIASRLSVTADLAEQRLRQDAERWRSRQRPAPQRDARHLADALYRIRAHRFRLPPTVIAAAAATAATAAAAVLAWALIPSGRQAPGGSSSSPAPVPLASAYPPPRALVLTPTRLITLESGHILRASGKFSWKLKVKVNKQNSTSGNIALFSGPGLCYGVNFTTGAQIGCGDTLSSSLSWQSISPHDGPPAGTALVFGVTSTPAARVVFTFAGTTRTVRTSAVSTPAIPGLRFFAAIVPAGHQTTAEAITATGHPIERTVATCVSAGVKAPSIPTAKPSGFPSAKSPGLGCGV